MPYENELASKASHIDIIKNPDVQKFISECDYLKPPSDAECQAVSAMFCEPPNADNVALPDSVVAVDGSHYEASIEERLPSTKIGFVKIGAVLIVLKEYQSLRVDQDRFVDPFRVAKLQKNNSPLTFALPSANIQWGGRKSVRDSFRAAIDEYLYDAKTRFNDADATTSIRTTLFHLAALRTGELGTGDPSRLKIHICPSCEKGPVEILDTATPQFCPFCKQQVYATDCLRVWEEVNDYQSNLVAMSRFMMLVEHLLPVHYMRYLEINSLISLGSMAFFVDGPLAIFGNGAWLHACILRFLDTLNNRLAQINQPPMLIIGLQKTGQVRDHVNFIDRFIPANRLFAINDDYRYKYILNGREKSSNGFGYETYYGQDFIYKTPTKRNFIFALPYPFASKTGQGADYFITEKTNLGRYANLSRAIRLISHFETDLYKDAVVPIALAHHYTAISLAPGGKVLDILTLNALNK